MNQSSSASASQYRSAESGARSYSFFCHFVFTILVSFRPEVGARDQREHFRWQRNHIRKLRASADYRAVELALSEQPGFRRRHIYWYSSSQ